MNVVLWDTRVKRVIFLQVGELSPPPHFRVGEKETQEDSVFSLRSE